MMDRQQILAWFAVDSNGIILSEGAFHGEQFYIPYFFYLYNSGYRDGETGEVISFRVRTEDRVQFPELVGRDIVRFRKLPDGRVIEIK